MTDYLRDTALVFGPLALGGLIIGLAMTGNWRHLRFLFNAPLLISLLMWSLMILAYTQVAWDGGATKRALPAMVVGAIGLLLAAFQAFQSSFWRYIVTVIAAVFGFIQMCAIGVQASPVVIGSHFADVMDTLTLHKLDVRKMGVPSPSRYAEEPHLVLVDRLLGLRGKYNLDSATMFVAHTGSRAELINAFTLMFASQVKKTSFSVGIDPFISDPIAIASNWDYVIADDLSPLTVEDLESFRSTYAVAAARIVLDYRLKRPSPLVLLETIDVEGRNILFFRSDGRRGPQLTKK